MSITASEVRATQRKNAGGIDGAMQTRSGDAGHGTALVRLSGLWGKTNQMGMQISRTLSLIIRNAQVYSIKNALVLSF